jgi:hypothetical protein
MSGNRVTPEQVLAAYEATGLVAVRARYTDVTDDGKLCACGLSAVYIHQSGDEGYNTLRYGSEDDLITGKLNVTQKYLNSFIDGFDGMTKSSPADPQAYEDGKAAWEAVKHLAVSE